MSPIGPFIPPLLVFPIKNMKELMSGSPPGSIHACHSPGVDTERDFFPVVSSFHQTYKADKRKYCYFSTGRALITHQVSGGHCFSSRESCWHHLPPTSQQPQMQTLDKTSMGPLKFYCQEIEKWFVHAQGKLSPSTKLANYSVTHTSELQQAK